MEQENERHLGLTIFLAALTALLLFAVSFQVLLFGPITSFIADNTVNDRLSSLTHSQLVEVAEMGRAFVAGDRNATLPEGSDSRVSFTPDVVSHMWDVRNVLQGTRIVTLILTALWAAVLLLPGQKAGRSTIGTGLFFGGVMAVAIALLLAIIGGVSFNSLFSGMHQLFFAEGTWTFAEDSLLICAYPLPFWMGMGVIWAATLILFSALAATLGFFIRRVPGH